MLFAPVLVLATVTTVATLATPGGPPAANVMDDCVQVQRVHLASVRDEGLDALRLGEISGAFQSTHLPTRGGSVYRPAGCPVPAGWGVPEGWLVSPHAPIVWRLGAGRLGPVRVRVAPVSVGLIQNRNYPLEGRLDGPLWSGVGDGVLAEGGVNVSWGRFTLDLAPAVAWHENAPFEHPLNPQTPSRSPFAHPGHVGTLDRPLRHGAASFLRVLPGESEVRVTAGPLRLGASTRNLHWGPARRNPIVLGPTGPGFLHLFAGTDTPLTLGGVGLGAEWIVGRLDESAYFDFDPANDHRLMGGVNLSLRWDALPGLEMGLLHTRVQPWAGASEWQPKVGHLGTPFHAPFSAPLGSQERLEVGALYGRWVVPRARAEVYGEWGRENLVSGWLGRAPDVRGANAFTLGFEQLNRLDVGWLRARFELSSTRSGQALLAGGSAPSFYTHARVQQGYTHLGHPLGAPIGPGSDAQSLGLDWMGRWGRVGLLVERIRHDDDTYTRQWSEWYSYRGHDAELRGSIPVLLRWPTADWGVFEAEGELLRGRRLNRHFTGFERLTQPTRSEWTTSAQIGVRWRP